MSIIYEWNDVLLNAPKLKQVIKKSWRGYLKFRASLRFKKRLNFSTNPRKLSIFFETKWSPLSILINPPLGPVACHWRMWGLWWLRSAPLWRQRTPLANHTCPQAHLAPETVRMGVVEGFIHGFIYHTPKISRNINPSPWQVDERPPRWLQPKPLLLRQPRN